GAAVEQRISLVTLGVGDLARARTFYERLGWRGQELEETVFFQAGGLAVVLWGRDKLAGDGGIDDRKADGFGGIALAHNVRSRAGPAGRRSRRTAPTRRRARRPRPRRVTRWTAAGAPGPPGPAPASGAAVRPATARPVPGRSPPPAPARRARRPARAPARRR